MRGLIHCYSTTGNTRLVADRIAAAMTEKGVETVVADAVRESKLDDLASYDIVGFGAPTMAWKPSWGFFECIGLLPTLKKPVPSFVFCTSGGMPVNTLWVMAQALSQKNFAILDGLEVNAETNFPVARQFGAESLGGMKGKPDESDLAPAGPFGEGLVRRLKANDLTPKNLEFRFSPMHFMGKSAGHRELRTAMGKKSVDRSKCTKCATCALSCAAKAISLKPYPVFSNRCMGCWACYNMCPTEAITTTVTGGRGRFKGPALTR